MQTQKQNSDMPVTARQKLTS